MHIHNSPNCHDVIYGQNFIVIHHLQVNIVNTECKRFYFGCCYQSPPYLIVLYIHVYCRCFEYTTIVLAASGISFLEFNATFGKSGFVQKIATIFPGLFKDFSRTKLNFQGPPTRNVISQMVYKSTFPVQASRFLIRLQVFAPSPSLHFSVHLPFLFISCLNTRVLQCLKLLYTGKEYQSLYKALSF